MSVLSRRDLLAAGAAVAATTALPAEGKPGSKARGDLRDIKHVVVVMQENRSFDACGDSDGWCDVTITVSSDRSWSQRLTGHLETGRANVSG